MRLFSPILPSVPTGGTSIAKALKRLRTDNGISPDQLADGAGISRSTVYRIEGGEIADPDLATLRGLVKALNVSMSHFFAQVEAGDADTRGPSEQPRRSVLSPEDVLLLERLAWACAHAATSSRRLHLRSVLSELAIGFRAAADPTSDGLDRAIENARMDLEHTG
jgi:transcriptional regulator with XRE-family HTH domain